MNVASPRGDGDWEQFTAVEGQAFGTSKEKTEQYVASVRDHAIARFALEDDRVVGGALAFPCHQLIGGRPVSAGAIGSVCVAPELRGRGVGRAVMDGLVGAMRAEGLALAPLWPSSVAFYRSMGWELAGRVAEHSAPAEMLRGGASSGRAVRDPDLSDVEELRLAVSSAWTGPIVRPAWWTEWRHPDRLPEQSYRYGWREGDRLTGFVAFRHEKPHDRRWGFQTVVVELWTATADAFEGLLDLLSADGPLSPDIRFHYAALPDLPALFWRLPDLALTTTGTNGWMLRALDPAAAIAQAGWPREATGTLELGVGDERFTVTLADGTASVSDGAEHPVALDPGTFAAWYTGALGACDAARLGRIAGPPEAIAFMDALTAQRRPWLPDNF